MKKILFFILGLFFINSIYADIPEGYYNNASGLSGEVLITALHNIIDNHTTMSYGDARYILDETDADPANSSNLILIYTGGSVSGNWDAGITWNREHVWSKSHGFGDVDNDTKGPGSDLHNLKPSHPEVNTDRSEKDFDEGGNQHSIATECYSTSTTWEPRDAVKGDVARIMLYMSVRYQGDVSGEPDLVLVDNTTSYPNPEFGVISTLLRWHYEDPVDEFERNRNDVIYSYQNNRNPFIDHPEYVSKIWGGGSTNPAPTISNIIYTPEIPSSSETVSISATITDDSKISKAKLHWGLISGALIDTIKLTNTSGDIYTTEFDIPSQNDGTVVFFEIEAMDDSSGVSSSIEYSYEIDNKPPTEIINEDFTSCPVTGWTNYSVSGTKDWECSANGYLYANAYDGTGASDDWFISPSIDLDLYNDEYLTFLSWTKYTDSQIPNIELKYSTDYSGSDDPNSATWTNLSAIWSPADSQTWTESGKIDLSDITGSSVYIAFRYISSGTTSNSCTSWEIDNIFLTETPNELPTISEISNSPISPSEGTDVVITAKIMDSDGSVSSANVKWGTTSGSYPNSISMTNTGNDYSCSIPSQVGGTFVYYIIEATDNSSEIKLSGEKMFSFNSAANNIPVITDILLKPLAPTSNDGVTVSATITDSDGTISASQLRWGTETGIYEHDVVLIKNNDSYSAYIPAREENTEIYFVIYAADNNGGSVVSSENNYLINNPPEISNVDISPDAPSGGEDVTVSANVIDKIGSVASVVLKWKTSTGAFTNVNMSLSNSLYTGIIPGQIVGENVQFSIEATDDLGAISSYTFGNYTVVENDLPVISDVTINPTAPTSSDPVTVSANVTDNNGTIASVVLKWKTSTGTYTDLSMNFSSNVYSAIIPAQAANETIQFSIEATDNLGAISNYTTGSYTVSGSNGIEDIVGNRISLYPIPASNILNVEIEDYSGDIKFKVYDEIGSLVYSENTFMEKTCTFSISDLKTGLYLVNIRFNNNDYTQKIIIKRQ